MVDRAKFRRLLLSEKSRLAERIEAFGRKGLDRPLSESISELSLYDNHPADIATETFEREKDFGLREDQMTTMDMVEAALKRLDHGTYGTCGRCGRPIPEARLEAVPWTEFCVRCEEALEQTEARDWSRPAEEGVVAPLSAINDDDPQQRGTGFDSEDSWQAVARYGTSDTPADTPPAVEYGETFVGAGEDIGAVTPLDKVPDSAWDPDRLAGEGKFDRPPDRDGDLCLGPAAPDRAEGEDASEQGRPGRRGDAGGRKKPPVR